MAPRAVRESVASVRLGERALLAVSGGADSMVMASLLVERSPAMVAGIATFDHGTGAAATSAAALVVRWAEARGVTVRVGRATGLRRTEASWRAARWEFLRGSATALDARVATAHTRDDQAETVFMRLLRGSGVRGLAGLRADSEVLRPLLQVTRDDVRQFATLRGIPFHDDPSNQDLRFLRNRVRLDLLPRIARQEPDFAEWLVALGEQAAAWRRNVAELVDAHWSPTVHATGAVHVPRRRDHLPDEAEAGLFWPEVAGRVGVAMDWRGTARLASFTTKKRTGLRMPLSGGVEVRSDRRGWTLERAGAGVGAGSGGATPPIGRHHAAAT